MNRKVCVLTICVLSFSLLLRAQRREEGVEVKVENLEATPVGVSITLRAAATRETLQMMIGFAEGQSIARAMQHQKSERPMSHDLFKSFLDRNGWRVQKVLIRDLQGGTFLADLTLENDSDHATQVYDARPSDAMAIGLRYGAKIFVSPQVFEAQKKHQREGEKQIRSKPDELRL